MMSADDRFNVVAARGGDDIWIEIRRRRNKSDAAIAAAAAAAPPPAPVSSCGTDRHLRFRRWGPPSLLRILSSQGGTDSSSRRSVEPEPASAAEAVAC